MTVASYSITTLNKYQVMLTITLIVKGAMSSYFSISKNTSNMSCPQLNPKDNGPGLLFETIL